VPRALFLSNGTWSDGKTSRTWIRTTVFAHISPCSRHKDINSSEAAIQTGNGAEDDVASHLHVETLTPTLPSMPPFTSHAKPSISTIIPVVTLKDVLGLDFPLLNANSHRQRSLAVMSPFCSAFFCCSVLKRTAIKTHLTHLPSTRTSAASLVFMYKKK
jgi:hypothetical protein